jgi:hypothetical protein
MLFHIALLAAHYDFVGYVKNGSEDLCTVVFWTTRCKLLRLLLLPPITAVHAAADAVVVAVLIFIFMKWNFFSMAFIHIVQKGSLRCVYICTYAP